jgi:S1-C subfamily serine protease
MGGGFGEPAAPVDNPAVILPAFHLVDLGFTTHWESDAFGKIVRVTVTEVRPGSPAWKYGLRRNDAVKAIDHQPVAGMKRDDYLSLVQAGLEIGRSLTYTFVRSRGFIVYLNSSFELTWKLGLGPPHSPGPAPAPGPPVAGQKPPHG